MATQARIAPEPDGLGAVLDHGRAHGESSRAERARATGLGRSVLTQRVDALLAYGLLAEDRVGVSTGGRAPRLLRFRADAGYLLVADLGATSADVALADLAGHIVAHRQESSDIAAGPDAVLARVEELFDECVAEAGVAGSLWGVGIGVPGPVEFEAGRPIAPRWIRPSTTIPAPIPVPILTKTKSSTPRPQPAVSSPSAITLTSLSTQTGTPRSAKRARTA